MDPRLRWDVVKDSYLACFGPLFDAEEAEDGFIRLRFWGGGSPMVYASFGLPSGEVAIRSMAPFPGLEYILDDVVEKAPRLAPLEAVPCEIDGTMFEGLLVAPPEDGTLVLAAPGSEPLHIFRLVPITGPELGLWRDAPERLLELLRRGGALEGDPLRDCVLEPEHTREFWARELPTFVHRTRARIQRARVRRARAIEDGAPRELVVPNDHLISTQEAFLAHAARSRPGEVPEEETPEEAERARDRRGSELMSYVLDNSLGLMRVLLPEEAVGPVAQFLTLLLISHPAVQPRFLRAVGEVYMLWSVEEALMAIVDVLCDHEPQERMPGVLARTRQGLEEALSRIDPKEAPGSLEAEDPVATEGYVWACMYAAACDGFYGDVRIEQTLARVARIAQHMVEPEDKRQGAREQLLMLCGTLVMFIAMGFHMGSGQMNEH